MQSASAERAIGRRGATDELRLASNGWAIAFVRHVRQSPTATLATIVLAGMVLVAILAPVISPYDPLEMHIKDRLTGPSARFLMGTDETGRDMLSTLLHAARISLAVAFSAQMIALAIGVPLGLVAGYQRGLIDGVIMRFLDGFLAIPGILLALTIVGMFGTGVQYLLVAIGIINMPYVARITRAAVVVEREKDYVLAARAIGARDAHIMLRTLMPNCLSPLIVQASLGVAIAILLEASLSFLGLGVQPPYASWGTLLQTGYSYIRLTAWYVTFPGLFIFATVWSLNVIGDALRDALDPRLRKV